MNPLFVLKLIQTLSPFCDSRAMHQTMPSEVFNLFPIMMLHILFLTSFYLVGRGRGVGGGGVSWREVIVLEQGFSRGKGSSFIALICHDKCHPSPVGEGSLSRN